MGADIRRNAIGAKCFRLDWKSLTSSARALLRRRPRCATAVGRDSLPILAGVAAGVDGSAKSAALRKCGRDRENQDEKNAGEGTKHPASICRAGGGPYTTCSKAGQSWAPPARPRRWRGPDAGATRSSPGGPKFRRCRPSGSPRAGRRGRESSWHHRPLSPQALASSRRMNAAAATPSHTRTPELPAEIVFIRARRLGRMPAVGPVPGRRRQAGMLLCRDRDPVAE